MKKIRNMLAAALRWRKLKPLDLSRHSIVNYEVLVRGLLKNHPDDRDFAMVRAIGALSMEEFRDSGDLHVAVLRHHGLVDGMNIYDLGCGSGRTAQALSRAGWQGRYKGTDIVEPLVEHQRSHCPGYEAFTHQQSLDMLYAWSVFTHLLPQESYAYMMDIGRALKPGGTFILSFLEITCQAHWDLFESHANTVRSGHAMTLLDAFLHRDWIVEWAEHLNFSKPLFTDGDDSTHHPPFWQTIAVMRKL